MPNGRNRTYMHAERNKHDVRHSESAKNEYTTSKRHTSAPIADTRYGGIFVPGNVR